jgi:hypothetical protein
MQQGPNGTLVPVTEGSTRPVSVVIHGAGPQATRRYEFPARGSSGRATPRAARRRRKGRQHLTILSDAGSPNQKHLLNGIVSDRVIVVTNRHGLRRGRPIFRSFEVVAGNAGHHRHVDNTCKIELARHLRRPVLIHSAFF